MIKTGYKVRAGFPKHVMNNEKTVFQIGIKDKQQEGKWFNVSFMTDYIDLEAREEVEITSIEGFNVSEYNGKQQFTVFGKVERATTEPQESDYEPEAPQPSISINDDDLPF